MLTTTLASRIPALRPVSLIRSAAELLHAMRMSRESAAFRSDASGLDRVLRLDAPRALVELQVATSWHRLAAGLTEQHPWLQSLADDPGELPATVGQAVAANAPGPDGVPIVAHIESMTLATADGELRRVNRHDHPQIFALVVGGQGVIGAPYSITVRLDSLEQSVTAGAPEEVLDLRAPTERRAPSDTVRLLAPPERAENCVERLRARLREWRIEPLALSARPVYAERETFLRWAARDYVLLRLTLPRPTQLGAKVRTEQLIRELIDEAIHCGGSYPIASTRAASRNQAAHCYPALRAFLAEKRRQDPRDCLVNDWYRHHLQLLSDDAVPVRWDDPSNAPKAKAPQEIRVHSDRVVAALA